MGAISVPVHVHEWWYLHLWELGDLDAVAVDFEATEVADRQHCTRFHDL